MAQRRRLFWHLFPHFLLLIIVLTMAISWYASNTLRASFLSRTADDLHARALLLEDRLKEFLLVSDDARVHQICKQAGWRAATRITVILPDGRVIGDSHEDPQVMDNHAARPEIASALDGKWASAIRYSNTLQKNMMYVAQPIQTETAVLGVIRTSVSISVLDENVFRMQVRIYGGGIVIAIAAALFSLMLVRHISRPIEEMKQGAQRIAKGDFSTKLSLPHAEELAGLAESMNKMAVAMDDRMKTVVRQRKELEAVLSSMHEGVLALNDKEKIFLTNRRFGQILGVTSEMAMGRSLPEVLRSTDLQRFVDRAVTTPGPTRGDISLFTHTEIIIQIQSTPLRDADEKRLGTLFVINEVTKIKHLENMRRNFAANVSHEIKTPLTAIQGFVETLIEDHRQDDQQTERFLRIIDRHVRRLSAILEDLMSLSRIEQEEGWDEEIQLIPAAVLKMLSAVMDECQEKASENRVDLKLQCPPDLHASMASRLMVRACVNLVDNAINYSDKGNTVTVTARKGEGDVMITVQDEGLGIPAADQERVFERFYRVDKARSRESGGVGLGLAIAKHIAVAHGGTLTVESELNRGSRFTLTFPQ